MKKILFAMLLLPLLSACQPSKNPLSAKNEGAFAIQEGVWTLAQTDVDDAFYYVAPQGDRYALLPLQAGASAVPFMLAEIGGRTYVSIKTEDEKSFSGWLLFLLHPEQDGSISLVFFNELTDASVVDSKGVLSLSTEDARAWLEKVGARIRKFDKDGRPGNYIAYRRLPDEKAEEALKNAPPEIREAVAKLRGGKDSAGSSEAKSGTRETSGR